MTYGEQLLEVMAELVADPGYPESKFNRAWSLAWTCNQPHQPDETRQMGKRAVWLMMWHTNLPRLLAGPLVVFFPNALALTPTWWIHILVDPTLEHSRRLRLPRDDHDWT